MFLTGVIPLGNSKIITAKADNGEIYVAVKPMVEEMNLAWNPQHRKISHDERFNHMVIPLNLAEGGLQEMICIPHKKVLTWLYSINANKVKPEHKAKLIAFQEETEWAIYEYWTKGEAKRADFVGSEAYKQLQEHLFQLEMDKRELNSQITSHLHHIEMLEVKNSISKSHDRFESMRITQDKLLFASKMRRYAAEMYDMGKDLEEFSGAYYLRSKANSMARKLWASYSEFRDEIDMFEERERLL